MQQLLDHSFFGNTLLQYLTALGILLASLAGVYIFQHFVLAVLRRLAGATANHLDDMLVRAAEILVVPMLYFGVLYLTLHTLTLSPAFHGGLKIGGMVLFTLLAVRALTATIRFALRARLKRTADDQAAEIQLRGVTGLINITVWVIAVFVLLDNLGVKISAAVAGLGIGGIAVALAAQAILGDLFSYFVIFLDKPFEVGDFIVAGDKIGTVESIGIKTTRLTALSGEQIVFSNSDLIHSRLHNHKKMARRRIVFKLGVTYQTPAEKLREIPGVVRAIIERQTDASFDRGHFTAFGDSSLDFEFVYYVESPDYARYRDIQQAINLAVFEAFADRGIEFAYPTQTLFVTQAAPQG
jgi:small-conductance mechanosensitive channel